MSPTPEQIIAVVAALVVYLGAAFFADRALTGLARALLRWVVALTAIGGFFVAMGGLRGGIGPLKWAGLIRLGVIDQGRAVEITKMVIAGLAAVLVFWDRQRIGERRPFAARWRRLVAVVLGLAAITAYFGGFHFTYPKFYHRWDQYHYYMGAKYFRELGYDRLYRCTLIAEDELGDVAHDGPESIGHGRAHVDMSKEVRGPDKKIRNLGADNLLVPVGEMLDHPEICKAHFSPDRWESYKADVAFFRVGSDRKYWDDMQQDHGYNPPPVWTIAGHAFASIAPAGHVYSWPVVGRFNHLQALSVLDLALCAGMFAALGWAFGARAFALGAIVWGTQAAASSAWTIGAFLRQDWLFWLVLGLCLSRKRWPALAAAAVVYAALLRVFPGLVVIGWLGVAGWHIYRRGALHPTHKRMLLGGTLAAAILVPASLAIAGRDAYAEFYRHTLQVHDRTPLTNHMGLRVLVSQPLPFDATLGPIDVGRGTHSGRMKYTRDNKLPDPFEVWKRLRNERYDRVRPVAYAIVGLFVFALARVTRRLRSMWAAGCLAQVFIILMAQLTCYYYAFMILLAPLSRVRRQIEAPLLGFCILSQIATFTFTYYDDRYWVLTALSLGVSTLVLWLFLPLDDRAKVWATLRPAPKH